MKINVFAVPILLVSFVHYSLQQNSGHKPSQGNFTVRLKDTDPLDFIVKTVYNETQIFLKDKPNTNNGKAAPETCKREKSVTLSIVIIGVPCKGHFSSAVIPKRYLMACFRAPQACISDSPSVYWVGSTELTCGKPTLFTPSNDWKYVSPDEDAKKETSEKKDSENELPASEDGKNAAGKPDSENVANGELPSEKGKSSTRKRDAENPTNKKDATQEKTSDDKTRNDKTTSAPATKAAAKPVKYKLTDVPLMGEYLMILFLEDESGKSIKPVEDEPASFDLEIGMRSPVGYLSADEYPLKTFYLVMCIIYVFYALGWLVISACNYHDLLRVQFWIGGVILLGLIEKAVHYAEYTNVNESGISEMGTEKFAAFVECVKKTVARMLVIIVSLGFGIVKPRLGPTLHKVIGIGVIYFIVAFLERMISIDVYFNEGSGHAWIAMYVPLAIIDSIICYWVFMSLLQTMKTLRLRRNTTKLTLYRHFANTIVFCVLVSLGLMIWTIVYHRELCNSDFANGWFETAGWPLIFSIILLVIMILWRPNANNQRYAYSPMIDGNGSEDDDDVEEPMLGSGATETMKMRGTKKIVRSDIDKTEEDLKWIEENIPQTVVDAAVPALIDSEEEGMSTKYEMSKME